MVLFSMIFGRTELIRSVSKAKFDEEADGEVHLSLNPLKPNQKHKKLFRTEFFHRFFFSSVEKQNVGNRLKCILAKLRVDRSHPRGVSSRSKF